MEPAVNHTTQLRVNSTTFSVEVTYTLVVDRQNRCVLVSVLKKSWIWCSNLSRNPDVIGLLLIFVVHFYLTLFFAVACLCFCIILQFR